MVKKYLLAGFGGQGILFSGKFLAYKGLMDGNNVSWLPSYGPEMRGGTANCSVIISDDLIGAPIVLKPDVLVAMNVPSLDKYEDAVVPGGTIYVDSTMVDRKVKRDDVEVHYLPASMTATEKNMEGLANMIIMGKLLENEGALKDESVEEALSKCISARHQDLYSINLDAMMIGSEM